MADVRTEAAAAVFAVWPTLTYFSYSDTHSNNGLQPPSPHRGRSLAPFLVVTRIFSRANRYDCDCDLICGMLYQVRLGVVSVFRRMPLINT